MATLLSMQDPFPSFLQARSQLLLEEIAANERTRLTIRQAAHPGIALDRGADRGPNSSINKGNGRARAAASSWRPALHRVLRHLHVIVTCQKLLFVPHFNEASSHGSNLYFFSGFQYYLVILDDHSHYSSTRSIAFTLTFLLSFMSLYSVCNVTTAANFSPLPYVTSSLVMAHPFDLHALTPRHNMARPNVSYAPPTTFFAFFSYMPT